MKRDDEELVEEEFDEDIEDTSEETTDVVEDKAVKAKSKSVDDDEEEEKGGNFASDDYFTEYPSWKHPKYWIFDDKTHIVRIAFSTVFPKIKEVKAYEEFVTSCVSKKAYHKMFRLFTHSANAILAANPAVTDTFMYKYYSVKKSLDNHAYEHGNPVLFISSVVNLFDVGMINEIRKYVLKYYRETGDKDYKLHKDTYIEAITFLDCHIRVLYVVSRMIHLIVPLCLEYIKNYREVNAEEILNNIFDKLFELAQENNPEYVSLTTDGTPMGSMDVKQKLYNFVESKVRDTLKSDESMWNRLKFLGTNWKRTVIKIQYKLIRDIIPEYTFNGNAMNMNSVVTRKSIMDYTLRKPDNFTINCLVDASNNDTPDDNAIVTEAEQFDSYNSRHDAFIITIRHCFAEDTVDKFLLKKGINVKVDIDPAEYKFYLDNLKHHEFQQFVVFSSVVNTFGGTENIYGVNRDMYVKLICGLKILLERFGMSDIAAYLTGTRNRHYISNKESRMLHNALINDELYNSVINTKYKWVQNIINGKNNFIESKINYLINNEFSYNCMNPELNGRIIPRNEEAIRRGVLKFFNAFVY